MPKAKYQKEANGLYYAYVKTGLYTSTGKPEYKKFRAKTVAALDAKLDEYKKAAAFHLQPEKITVDAWFDRWFTAYKASLKPNTQSFYKTVYNTHIRPAIGGSLVSAVSEAQCQAILTALSASHARRTVKGVRGTLYSLFDKARANRLIAVNPCEYLRISGAPPKKRRPLTLLERQRYLAACQKHPFGTFAAFIYFFGLRRGEALALTGADVRPDHIAITRQIVFTDNNQPTVSTLKTAAGVREIPIPIKARKYIDFSRLPSGPLFTGADGQLLSYSEITARWSSFIRYALGADSEITMHYLRHNYCTMLFEQNVDLMTVKTLAGHEKIETTLEIYTHYTETLQKSSVQNVLMVG